MEQGLMKVLSFISIIILGYALKRMRILREETFQVLSGIVMCLTLPCVIISSINGVPIEYSLLLVIALGCGGNLIAVGLGYWANRRKGGAAQAFSMLNLSGYNIGLFAMPYVQTFFSPLGFLATCLFDAGNAIMCTGATYGLAAGVADAKHKFELRAFLKTMFSSVPLCTYMVMIALAFMHLSLPSSVLAFTKIIGDANTFLCMLMIGVSINLHMTKDDFKILVWHVAVRFAFSSVLALFFYFCLPLPAEVRHALAVLAFAPISSISLVFTVRLGGDLRTAGNINSVYVGVSVIMMTLLLMVM